MWYKVIKNVSLSKLEDEVTQQLRLGWRCQGGITFNLEGAYLFYYQAVIWTTEGR